MTLPTILSCAIQYCTTTGHRHGAGQRGSEMWHQSAKTQTRLTPRVSSVKEKLAPKEVAHWPAPPPWPPASLGCPGTHTATAGAAWPCAPAAARAAGARASRCAPRQPRSSPPPPQSSKYARSPIPSPAAAPTCRWSARSVPASTRPAPAGRPGRGYSSGRSPPAAAPAPPRPPRPAARPGTPEGK
eukprot:scaffold43934_cov62-Phaeocystis_antarctica.AAC.4